MYVPPSSGPSNQPQAPNFGDAGKYLIQGQVFGSAANAANGVGATAGVGDSSTNAMWNITLEAMGDLAAIDMALRQSPPNTALANQYAQDLMNNCNGKSCPAMNTIISGMSADFTMTGQAPNIQVTAINAAKFQTDWDQPTTSGVGGIQQIFQNILGATSGPNQMPQLGFDSSNIMDFAKFFLFLSDTMLCPTVTMSGSNPAQFKYGGQSFDLSTFIWGASGKGPEWGGMYFQDLLPMVIGTAFYEQDGSNYGQFQSDMSSFISLFPTQAQLDAVYKGQTKPDFTGYDQALAKLDNLNSDYPAGASPAPNFPPQDWITTLTSPPYNYSTAQAYQIFGCDNGASVPFGTQLDLSFFFQNFATSGFDAFTVPGVFE